MHILYYPSSINFQFSPVLVGFWIFLNKSAIADVNKQRYWMSLTSVRPKCCVCERSLIRSVHEGMNDISFKDSQWKCKHVRVNICTFVLSLGVGVIPAIYKCGFPKRYHPLETAFLHITLL